ncbi:MAG: hypothetical protein IPM63_05090 [Acidobacteriota bacterium]|nr:MAG: hypothetical protein IPM63_05090 [Acidobacteriota bacterium]
MRLKANVTGKFIPEPWSKLGLAMRTLGLEPINGLRHPPEGDSNGWYVWCGDTFSEEDDFFEPLHIEHIDDYLPSVRKYLDLPPGWRFQIDSEGYEDVWFDGSLVELK